MSQGDTLFQGEFKNTGKLELDPHMNRKKVPFFSSLISSHFSPQVGLLV